jgi:hypothetical protein
MSCNNPANAHVSLSASNLSASSFKHASVAKQCLKRFLFFNFFRHSLISSNKFLKLESVLSDNSSLSSCCFRVNSKAIIVFESFFFLLSFGFNSSIRSILCLFLSSSLNKDSMESLSLNPIVKIFSSLIPSSFNFLIVGSVPFLSKITKYSNPHPISIEIRCVI